MPSKKSPHNVYLWGTSKKGTIPLHMLLSDPTLPSGAFKPPSSSSSSASQLFSGDETVLDHPMRLNLDSKALASFLGSEGGGDEVALEKVFCGASGTAVVTTDGRCFVMGSNKNGELG
jgi:alpha-tubulin suppressor-like RCC1 family protein